MPDASSRFSVYATIALVAAALVAAWWIRPRPAPSLVSSLASRSYPLPEGQAFTRTTRHGIDISPDGTTIAYIANRRIFRRSVDEGAAAEAVTGSDVDPLELAFSPDGQSLVFSTPGKGGTRADATLTRIDLGGGTPGTLDLTGEPYGMRWEGGRIIVSLGNRVVAVSQSGGTPETLLAVPDGVREIATQPQLIGDGRYLLFAARKAGPGQLADEGHIAVQPVRGAGSRRVLVANGTDARVLPSGHLIWIHSSTIYGQAIDLRTLEMSGSPIAMTEGVRQTPGIGTGHFAVSATGTLVYAPGNNSGAEPTGAQQSLVVVPHWLDELKARVKSK